MAQRALPLDRFHRLLAQALASGGRRITLARTVWNIAADCYNPYTTTVVGRPEKHPGDNKYTVYGPGRPQAGWLEIETRCRRCERCLRARARRWRGAAKAELAASSRTWFGTLTLRPTEVFRMTSIARAKLDTQGIDYDALDVDEQYDLLVKAISPELTKYIKRWRKGKRGIRYLLVAEKHKSGLPHFHMLVHEAPLGDQVTHHDLSTKWTMGFERWRLSDPQNPRSALYLCKYLTKSVQARVRASQGYGVATSQMHTYVIAQLRKAGRVELSEPNGNEEPEW